MIVTDQEIERRVMATLPLKNLPLGFRFHPKDEELVNHYLKGKIDGRIRNEVEVIPVIDVCKCEPWDLPDKSLIRSDDPEWFFFGAKDRKYSNGHRSNRATEAGYWKATGKDRTIRSRASIVGMKKTLVFHRGRAPKGTRTSWIMHEYRTTEPEYESGEQGGYVLYRLFKKPDDKSLSSNSDVVEGSGFSPAPSRSPGDTHHEADMLVAIPLKQASSESDSRELKPFLSSDRMHTGIKRWHNDRSDCSTTKSVKQEGSLCDGIINSNALHHEAELGLKVDNIGGMLAPKSDMQVELLGSDDFPDIGSRYQNYSSSSNVNQGPQMGLHPDDDSVEHDSLDELLSAMLGNQEDSCSGGSMLQKDLFAEMAPEGDASNVQPFFWDSPSGMESMWVGNLGTDTRVAQGGDLLCTSPASFNLYSDTAHEFVNPFEWVDPLPYNNVGPDVLSVDSTNESLHEFPSCMENQGNGKNTGSNRDRVEDTGIKIRTREPHGPESLDDLVTHQGLVLKRIHLQCKLEGGPFSMGSTDQEGQVAAAEGGDWLCTSPAPFNSCMENQGNVKRLAVYHQGGDWLCTSPAPFNSCMENQGNGKNTGSNGDCVEDTGIKVRTHEPHGPESPNVLVTLQGRVLKNTHLQCKLEGGPFSMGSTDQEGQVAAAKEGEQSSVGRGQELALAPLDKLEDLSVHEDSDSTLLGEKYHEPKPTLRPRRKINEENGHDHKAPTLNENTSKKVSPLPFILVVMLLILLVGIWKLTSFQ